MIEKWKSWQPKQNPVEPPDWDEDIVYAYRALTMGKANEGQQQLVVRYLEYVTGSGEFDDVAYRPGGSDAERDTNFALGKRFVGQMFRKLLGAAVIEAIERERKQQETKAPVRRRAPAKNRGAKK